MMKAAAPRVGGERIAPIPEAASIPPAFSFGYPAFFSTGQVTAPSETAVAVPDPETVPRRKPDRATVRPGAAFDFLNREKLRSMKKLAAPGLVEDRTVDREEDDVGGSDVEGDAVEAGGIVVEGVDDLIEVLAGVGAWPTDRNIGPVVAVEEEDEAEDRQDQARGSPCCLENEEQENSAHHDVE